MAEFYSGNFGSYDSQPKVSFKAFEIAPVIERIVTTSADRPKTVGCSVISSVLAHTSVSYMNFKSLEPLPWVCTTWKTQAIDFFIGIVQIMFCESCKIPFSLSPPFP